MGGIDPMHEYLKNQIHDEIKGAIDYLEKALEYKSKSRDIATKFFKMSEMEVEHANCLTNMFNSVDKPTNVTDAEFSEMQKSVINDYVTSMGKIESMKKLYWSK